MPIALPSSLLGQDLPEELAQQLDPLLRMVNDLAKAVRLLHQRGITFADHLACEPPKAVYFDHGVERLVSYSKIPIARGVLCLSASAGYANPAIAFRPTSSPGVVGLTCYFLDTAAKGVKVSFVLTAEGNGTDGLAMRTATTVPASSSSGTISRAWQPGTFTAVPDSATTTFTNTAGPFNQIVVFGNGGKINVADFTINGAAGTVTFGTAPPTGWTLENFFSSP